MSNFYINKTDTGYTVTVDGKLRGSRIKTQQEAIHQGRLLTDQDYRWTWENMQKHPERAVEESWKFLHRKEPAYYARQARQALWYLRGRAMPKKGLGLEESPMTWEGAKARWGEAWKYELYRYILGLQRALKQVEDAEALSLLRKMAKALTRDDRETYYEGLNKLMEWYGEIW